LPQQPLQFAALPLISCRVAPHPNSSSVPIIAFEGYQGGVMAINEIEAAPGGCSSNHFQ
jgi:hypothetical protein